MRTVIILSVITISVNKVKGVVTLSVVVLNVVAPLLALQLTIQVKI
jgi:hypothetical protein